MVEILGIITFFVFIFIFKKSRQFHNPFKLIMIIGKKGAGKSTSICALSNKYINKGWTVYSTEDTPGTFKVRPEQIGYTEFEPYSVLFIDEIGLIWHSREFKSFAKEVREWFKLQRHRKLIVYCFSQAFDIDKGLRDLCDEIWLIKCYFNIFSVRKKIIKNLDVAKPKDQSSDAANGGFIDELKIVPWIVPGARRFVYIPKYEGYFDSYDARKLNKVEYPFTGVKMMQCKKHRKVQKALRRMELRRILNELRVKILTYRYRKGWIKGL